MIAFTDNARMVLRAPIVGGSEARQSIFTDPVAGWNELFFESSDRQFATLVNPATPSVESEVIIIVGKGLYTAQNGREYFILRPYANEHGSGWPAGTFVECRVTADMLSTFVQHRTYSIASALAEVDFGRTESFQFSCAPALHRYPISADSIGKSTSAECLKASAPVDLGSVVSKWTANEQYWNGSLMLSPAEDEQWVFVGPGAVTNAVAPTPWGDGAQAFSDDQPAGELMGRWYSSPLPVVRELQTHNMLNSESMLVTEVGFICDNYVSAGGAVPRVSIGTQDASTRFVSDQPLSDITASKCVHRFHVTGGGAAVDSVVFTQTGTTTGTFEGRFYVKGFLF